MSTSLADYSSGIFTPSADQRKAIAALDEFLGSDEKVFMLKGYAGTGKTTLTKMLAGYVESTKRVAVLMAPTGRAARIMLEKTGHSASTIHKAIYNMEMMDEVEIKKDGKVQYKFRYGLRETERNITNVYLVDEASMISDRYSEDDFFIFGSGIILKDLLTLIAPGNLARKDKLIFIGDDAQLAPVTDSISGALDRTYLFEHYGIDSTEYQLTEVIRQASESGILGNATSLRQLIGLPGRQKFQLNTDYPDVAETTQEQMVQRFLEINPTLNVHDGIVLVAKNSTALDHNLSIRQEVFPHKSIVQPGETFLINQNNYNYEVELLNGMLVKVLEVDEHAETKSHMMSYDADGKECFVTHRYRWVSIEVPMEKGAKTTVRCMILDSFLWSPKPSLDYAENIALYIDFKLRHQHLKPKTPEFSKAVKSDPYFNALKVKFGYAITVHKAQGGEWERVLVNMDHYQGYTSKLFLRWAYTAITRASKELTVYNMPSYSIFSKLEYRDQRLATDSGLPGNDSSAPKKILLELPKQYEQHLKDWFVQEPAFILEKYHTLLAQLQDSSIVIAGRKKRQYAEEYIFTKEGKQVTVTYYYNGKDKFTRVMATGGQVQDSELLIEVLALTEKPVDFLMPAKNEPLEVKDPLVPDGAEEEEVHSFSEKFQPLKPLFTVLNELTREKNITISEIEHLPYLERYFLERGAQKAMIQFWYDGLQQFTTATPHLPSCNSNELLEDVAGVVNTIYG